MSKITTTYQVDANTHFEFKKKCLDNKMSMAKVIESFMKKYVKR